MADLKDPQRNRNKEPITSPTPFNPFGNSGSKTKTKTTTPVPPTFKVNNTPGSAPSVEQEKPQQNPFRDGRVGRVYRGFKPPVTTEIAKSSSRRLLDNNRAKAEKKKLEDATYKIGYYVSMATCRYIAQSTTNGHLTTEDLPFMYNIALKIARLLRPEKRTDIPATATPTLSDFELAVAFRNRATVEAVASGNASLVDPNTKKIIMRKEGNNSQAMPKAELMGLWKALAERLLEGLEKDQAIGG